MPSVELTTDTQIAEFEARHSRLGLLRRYARARLRLMPVRLLMALVGVILVGTLISPSLAGVTLALAVLGECIDGFMMAQVRRRAPQPDEVGVLVLLTSASAGLQALSVSACFALTYASRPDPAVALFVIAFLFAMAIGDLMLIAFHRIATLVRLAIHGATLLAFFVYRVMGSGGRGDDLLFEVVGVAVLAFVVWSCVRGLEGATLRGFASNRDILHRQREIEQAGIDLKKTQDENRRLALVARHANDSVIVSQVDGPILWVNAAFTKTTGYAADEAIGRSVADLLNGPETNPNTIARIARAVKAGKPCRTDILNYTKSGQKIWVDTNIVPLTEEDGTARIVIAIERNVTEARRQMDGLAQATQEARALAQDRSTFLATMSHEIRTPMNGIMGMTDVLSRAGLGPEEQAQVDTIRDSAGALLKVIDDVLDLSRLEGEKLPIVAEVFSVPTCVKSAVMLMRPLAQEKALTLDVSFDGPTSTRVEGDAGRLRQILLNLIGNALKFTQSGGVSITVSANKAPSAIEFAIEVRDTGIGVDPDQAEAIFDQFAQAGDHIVKEFGGTGLGLAISRHLARRMGGDLVLKPTEDPGAVFVLTLTLPVATDAQDHARGTDLTNPPGDRAEDFPKVPEGLRILVAEDNATNRMVLDRFLDGTGAELFFAVNGREAVERAAQHRPDVVLMDMQMPELSGPEAARQIRALDIRQPRIIAITGGALPDERDKARAFGIETFLLKPVDRRALLDALSGIEPGEKPLGPDGAVRVSG